MWWKILIAVLCGAYLISPVDLSMMHLNVDDIIAALGTISSIIAAVNQAKNKGAIEQSKADKRLKY